MSLQIIWHFWHAANPHWVSEGRFSCSWQIKEVVGNEFLPDGETHTFINHYLFSTADKKLIKEESWSTLAGKIQLTL